MKRFIRICVAAGMIVFSASVAYAPPMPPLPSDDFDDNSMNPTLWTLYEDDHSNAWLDEINQRLEFRSTANADDVAALYLANQWGLLPTDDFSFKVDFYYYYPLLMSESGVLLGIGKDDDNFVLIGAGYDGDSYFWYEAEAGGGYAEGDKDRTINDGTLYISYNATADELYLSDTGYGSGDPWVTIPNLLQDVWGGDVVAPFIGGWSEYMALASGEAYLDNFVVDSGIVVPEPATIALLGLGALSLLRRRKA